MRWLCTTRSSKGMDVDGCVLDMNARLCAHFTVFSLHSVLTSQKSRAAEMLFEELIAARCQVQTHQRLEAVCEGWESCSMTEELARKGA